MVSACSLEDDLKTATYPFSALFCSKFYDHSCLSCIIIAFLPYTGNRKE